MTNPITLEEVTRLADQLSPQDRKRLAEHLDAQVAVVPPPSAEEIAEVAQYTDEDWQTLAQPQLLTPAEAVEQGLTGVWEDVGDGAEWVNAQRSER